MPNHVRGEAALEAGGRQYRLLLTLGALAEIEDGLGICCAMLRKRLSAKISAGSITALRFATLPGWP